MTWAEAGGQDGQQFSIDSATGILSFKKAPDFEVSTDYPDVSPSSPDLAHQDNQYIVTISATNLSGISSYHTVSVKVKDIFETTSSPQEITSIPPTPAPTPAPTPSSSPAIETTANPSASTLTKAKSIKEANTSEEIAIFQLRRPIKVGEQNAETLILGTDNKDKITGTSNSEILTGGIGRDILKGGGGADGFLFQNSQEFGKKAADKITDFNIEEGDSLIIDQDSFSLKGKAKLKNIYGKNAAKKATRSRRPFVYNNKKGLLYFNANGSEKGWGDGGLFVKLKGSPDLDASVFEIV